MYMVNYANPDDPETARLNAEWAAEDAARDAEGLAAAAAEYDSCRSCWAGIVRAKIGHWITEHRVPPRSPHPDDPLVCVCDCHGNEQYDTRPVPVA